jgi:hypothetical protein
MLMDAAVADTMDREKTSQLLRLLSTDLIELADAVDSSPDPDTDTNVREKWDDVSDTMNSVFSIMSSEEEFDAKMEELIQQKMQERPSLSRESAEEEVLNDMNGDDDDDDDESDGNEGGDDEVGDET